MPVTYRVIITPRAFADLDRILTDVGAKSPSGASRLISDLLREMEQLRQFPHRHALVQGRKHPAGPVRTREKVAALGDEHLLPARLGVALIDPDPLEPALGARP